MEADQSKTVSLQPVSGALQNLMRTLPERNKRPDDPRKVRTAYSLATRLYSCYRKEDAAAAETMLDAAAIVLASYSDEVMNAVTHPVTGIPGRIKWPPNIAEIREACETAIAPIRRDQERRRRLDESRRLTAEAPHERMTMAEIHVRHGTDYGLGHVRPDCESDLREKPANFKVPSWDEIMDGGSKLIPCRRMASVEAEGGATNDR